MARLPSAIERDVADQRIDLSTAAETYPEFRRWSKQGRERWAFFRSHIVTSDRAKIAAPADIEGDFVASRSCA
jgi:hypothetical protein